MPPTVFVVDDDPELRKSLAWMLSGAGIDHDLFPSAEDFLKRCDLRVRGCVLLDVRLQGIDGLELQQQLATRGAPWPIIIMSGHADVPMAVRAMEAGAVSVIEKPFTKHSLLSAIDKALQREQMTAEEELQRRDDQARVAGLTPREREIMAMAVRGEPTKRIASRLGISNRTVDKHRERILAKTRADSWADLVALSMRLGDRQRDPPQ